MMSEHELNRLLKDRKKAEAKGNLSEEAQIYNAIGEIYSRLGQHEEAIEQHEMELRLSESLDDTVGAAIAHRKIGECHCDLADYGRALHHQQLHLKLAERAASDIEVQRAQATIGRTYLCQSEGLTGREAARALKMAELAFWKSLEVCKKLESVISSQDFMEMKSRLLLNLGLVHENKGEKKKSLDLIKRAILIAEKGNLYEDLQRCHYTMADMYERSSQLRLSLRSIDTALKCAQKAKDKFTEWEAIEKKARIFVQIKDFAASRRCLKKTLKSKCPSEQHKTMLETLLKTVRLLNHYDEKMRLAGDESHETCMRLSEKMGDLLASSKLYKAALERYHKMLEQAEMLKKPLSEMIPVYVSLSQTYKDDKQYEKAVVYYRKELDCRRDDHEQVCRTLLNIAEAQELGGEEYGEIKSSYVEALRHASKAKDNKLQFHVLKSLSLVQKVFKDENLPKTEARLEKLMTCDGFTMDDELSFYDSQERDDDDDSDVSLEDFTDTDSSDAEEEYDRNQRAALVTAGRAKRSAPVKRNEKGETPLHRACIDGKLRTVQTLLEKGHPVNPRDFCGWLPLHEAANHGYVDIVQCLVEQGAWINDRGGQQCGGVTPLHDAAACGNLDVVQLLIKLGANIHAKDDEGSTALESLHGYRETLGDDIGRTELAEILHVEKLVRRTMQGNNPHMESSRGNIYSDDDDDDDDVLPDIQPHSTARKHRLSRPDVGPGISDMGPEAGGECREDTIYTGDDPVLYVIHTELDQLQDPDTARDAYRSAITGLGSAKSRPSLMQQNTDQSANQGPALVGGAEIMGDDWLIDDMPSTAKRKLGDVDDVFKGSSANKRRRSKTDDDTSERVSVDSVKKKKQRAWIEDDSESLAVLDDYEAANHDTDLVIQTVDQNLLVDDFPVGLIGTPASSNPVASRKKKSKQLTLTQCSSISRLSQRSRPELSLHRDEFAVPSSVVTPTSAIHSDTVPAVWRFRVKIKDLTLMVPIVKGTEDPCISVLADAAAERYYKQCNLRPILSLVKDGAILSADEPINLVLSNMDEVVGIVDSWDLPPLPVRYMDACKSLKATVYRNIQTALRRCESNQTLSLAGLSLRPTQFSAVSRALQYQVLHTLDIQGNKLSDIGVQHLTKVLHTLPNLTSLNLGSNNISHTGLAKLLDCVTDPNGAAWEKPLQNLQQLVVSHNPLGNGSTPHLGSLLHHLPQLITLTMAACQLTVKFFQEHRISLAEALTASLLQKLDVSYNNLGSTGVELLLMCVNHRRLTTLDISNTVRTLTGNNVSKHLEHYLMKEDCVLENLVMNSTCLCLDNTPDISRFVGESVSLRRLSLSGHPKLDMDDLLQLLTASTGSHVDSVVMMTCQFSGALSTDLIDAVSSALYCDSPLRHLHFQVSGDVSDLDARSLRQIWSDKWSERAQFKVTGGLVMMDVLDE